MFEAIFGSKSRQKILLFLFVNGRCYGSQLQRLLNTSLTPIQNALIGLEKGGVISSYFEGKTRVYQFNASFPLLDELETLLKKAYTLLPPHEKKMYNSTKLGPLKAGIQDEKEIILLTFWEKLSSIKHLFFNAKTKSKQETGWNGKGKGEVHVAKEGGNILIFNEKGSWKGESGKEIDFSNVFRWTLDKTTQMISLEHLRRGLQHPVFLFHLAPSANNCLTSVDSHFCEEDTYFGQIFYDSHGLRLNWRIIGRKKNEELDYYYT